MTAQLITDNWSGPLSSLSGNDRLTAPDLDEDDPRFFLETDDGRGHHELGFTEYLRFHTDHDNIDSSLLDEGWLTHRGREQVADYLKQLLAQRQYDTTLIRQIRDSLEVTDQVGGDDPHITVSLTIDSDTAVTVQQFFDQAWAPFAGAMTNVTDPGTFDHEYLFSEVTAAR